MHASIAFKSFLPLTFANTGSVRGCFKCVVQGTYVQRLSKMIYPGLRRFLPLQHPFRADPAFGEPCKRAPFILNTHSSIREDGADAVEAYAQGCRQGDPDDPARVTGVFGVPETAQLEYFDASACELIDPMHVIANPGSPLLLTFTRALIETLNISISLGPVVTCW